MSTPPAPPGGGAPLEQTPSTSSLSSISSRGRRRKMKQETSQSSALVAGLLPSLAAAGINAPANGGSHTTHTSHFHNPFSIGALGEDGKERPAKSSKEEESKEPRKSKRRSRLFFGRSLSPFRHLPGTGRSHSSTTEQLAQDTAGKHSSSSRRSSSVSRLKTNEAERRAAEDGAEPRTSSDSAAADDASDTTSLDSDGEVKGGIVPRLTAFSEQAFVDNLDEDEDAYEEARASVKENEEQRAASEEQAKRESQERIESHRRSRHEDAPRPKPKRQQTGRFDVSVEQDSDGEEAEEDADDEEEEEDLLLFDDETIDNTLYNAGCIGLHDAWRHDEDESRRPSGKSSDVEGGDEKGPLPPSVAALRNANASGYGELLEAPNLVTASDGPLPSTSPQPSSWGKRPTTKPRIPDHPTEPEKTDPHIARKGSKYILSAGELNLVASSPEFQRNRCTIILTQGDFDEAVREADTRRRKRYIVASDGSEESSYATEWTIGTVLRDGDEVLIISCMETDTKLDSTRSTSRLGHLVHGAAHHHAENEEKARKRENQKIRQSMAVLLARQATALLQRTRLNVRISCQALHCRNGRHMILDIIDYYEPTMVVVGSRGLGSLKGILLGSTSHYLVQKSSVPVMVVRKRLRLPPLPRGKSDVVLSVRERHLSLDKAAIEKESAKEGEEGEGDPEKDDDEGKTKEDEEVEGEGPTNPEQVAEAGEELPLPDVESRNEPTKRRSSKAQDEMEEALRGAGAGAGADEGEGQGQGRARKEDEGRGRKERRSTGEGEKTERSRSRNETPKAITASQQLKDGATRKAAGEEGN